MAPKTKPPGGVTPKRKGTSPKSKAIKKKGEEKFFAVESILDHKYDGKGLRFLVKWAGYPESQSQWVSMAKMGCPERIDEYLKDACEKKQAKKTSPKAKKTTTPKVAKPVVTAPSTPPVVQTAQTAKTASPPRRTPKRKAAPLFECEIVDQPLTEPRKKKENTTRRLSDMTPAQGSSKKIAAKPIKTPVFGIPIHHQKTPVGQSTSNARSNSVATVKVEGEPRASSTIVNQSQSTSRNISQSSTPVASTSGEKQVRVKTEDPDDNTESEDQQMWNNHNDTGSGSSVENLVIDESDAQIESPSAPVVPVVPVVHVRGVSIKQENKNAIMEERHREVQELRKELASTTAEVAGVTARQVARQNIVDSLKTAEAQDREMTRKAMEKIMKIQERLNKLDDGQ